MAKWLINNTSWRGVLLRMWKNLFKPFSYPRVSCETSLFPWIAHYWNCLLGIEQDWMCSSIYFYFQTSFMLSDVWRSVNFASKLERATLNELEKSNVFKNNPIPNPMTNYCSITSCIKCSCCLLNSVQVSEGACHGSCCMQTTWRWWRKVMKACRKSGWSGK